MYKRSDPKKLVDWGNSARIAMLRPVSKDYILLQKFKLSLDENLQRPPLENDMSVLDAIADYLRVFHAHVVSELDKGFAKNYEGHHMRYCLTVPAMWSDKAKQTMRRAAIKAGLISEDDHSDRLMLISEPEAAALYCEKHCDQVNLGPGDRYMICDAGGGTVDLIVFEIESGAPTNAQVDPSKPPPPRRLREITKGAGQSCGSTFLDLNFRKLIEKKFRGQLDKIPQSAMDSMIDQFVDMIKPEFDGLEAHYLTLPASVELTSLTDPSVGLEEGVLTLSAAELKNDVFEPVISAVLTLIEHQLTQIPRQPPKAIFLVGGFGSSNYLYQRVQQSFAGRVQQILTPPRAGLAVVRGAVYFGLNPRIVTSRVTRRTYGINAGLPFDPQRDPPESRAIRPDGSIRCTTRFLDFVKKGASIPVDHVVKEDMYVYYGTLRSTDVMLYATENEEVPRYYNESGVHQVAAIEIPIPEMPDKKHGERVSYAVRMYFGLTELRMEAEFPGGEVWSVNCDFDAVDAYA